MPNGLSSITDSIADVGGNLARAATSRHRHSQHINSMSSALPVPQPPQHTNVTSQHARHLSADTTNSSHLSTSPSSGTEHRRNSQVNLTPEDGPVNNLLIEFEGGSHVIVRPNRIIRGKVILTALDRMYVSRIRIKFRAEEVALVRLDETGESRSERLHETITTFFEVDWKLWGESSTSYLQAGWDEIKVGKYEFPFALKFPNVNYPPSMEEPKGFGIRYVWTAQADGPALLSGLKSREYLTPYRPILVSTPDREWKFRSMLLKDKKTPGCEVEATLFKQSYCPDEPFLMHLKLSPTHSDTKITSVHFKFRKHHEGKMLVQKGTAFREHIRVVLQGSVPITSSNQHQFEEDISFNVPTRLVSPSFISHHTRVHYDLQFLIGMDHGGGLFKSMQTCDFSIPIIIANLPYDQLLRIPGLTSIAFYKNNKESPMFFDPTLDDPPEQPSLSDEMMGSIQQALMTSTPRDEPPNYFSIPTLPPGMGFCRERKERSVYLTRITKGQSCDLQEATVIPGLFDEGW